MPLTDALLVEDAATGLRDHLRETLNAQLENVYATSDDRLINMERVSDNHFYLTDAIEPLQTPAVFVIAESTSMILELQQGAGQRHTMIVGAVMDDIEATRLTKKAWRYARALYLSLHDISFGNCHVLVETVDYGPTLAQGAAGSRTFRKDVTLRCTVMQLEA